MSSSASSNLLEQYLEEYDRQARAIPEELKPHSSIMFGPESPLPAHLALKELWREWEVNLETINRTAQGTTALLRVLGIAGIVDAPEHRVSIGRYNYDLCREAEPRFIDAIRMSRRTKSDVRQPVITVCHDEASRPVFLQKTTSRTALSLVTLDIGGVPVPPGTILGVNSLDEGAHTGSYAHRTLAGKVTYRSYPITTGDQAVKLAPLRLSAWAHPDPEYRAFFGLKSNVIRSDQDIRFNPERVELVEQYSLDDFRYAASRMLEQCGIVPQAQVEIDTALETRKSLASSVY